MPKYLIQRAALPLVALLTLASGCQPSTPPPVASPSASTSAARPATSPSASPTTTASGTYTTQSLAGEYTLMVGDTAKKAMEKNGLNEFEGKIVLNSDGTFEAMVKISGTDPKETKPATSEIKAKGDFKVEANIVVLTGKSRMVDGKEDKPSPPGKYAISADGKVLKPEANDQLEISFVKK